MQAVRSYEFAKSNIGDRNVSKSWSKGVTLALEEPGKFTTISNIQEASWALIEDWPLEEGVALDKALLVIEAVMKGKKTPEDARLAFIAAAIEAGIEIKA
jgi:hypothetical protein